METAVGVEYGSLFAHFLGFRVADAGVDAWARGTEFLYELRDLGHHVWRDKEKRASRATPANRLEIM